MLVNGFRYFQFQKPEDTRDVSPHPKIGGVVDQEVVFILPHILTLYKLDAAGIWWKPATRPGIQFVIQQTVDFRGKSHARAHRDIHFKIAIKFSPRLPGFVVIIYHRDEVGSGKIGGQASTGSTTEHGPVSQRYTH